MNANQRRKNNRELYKKFPVGSTVWFFQHNGIDKIYGQVTENQSKSARRIRVKVNKEDIGVPYTCVHVKYLHTD